MAKGTKGFTGFRRIRLFSLFGFEVNLDLSWLFLALLISWSLGAGLFPVEYPGLSNRTYAWMGIACAVGVFFSIVFHEFSHSVIARRHGMPIRGITLFIFGGVAEMDEEPPSPKSEFLMAIAGPLASLLVALIFRWLKLIAATHGLPAPVIGVCGTLADINAVVALFNLVPAFPLDGGRMLRAALWHWQKDVRAATRFASQMGNGFGMAMMLLGVIVFLYGNVIGGMWWFVIGVFLRGAASASYQRLILHDMLHRRPVSEFMTREPVTVRSTITIRELVENYVYRYHFKMFPVVDDAELQGCVSIANVKPVPREKWDATSVRDVMEPSNQTNTVPADMDTEKLIAAMLHARRPARYMVTEGRKLAGVVSLTDVLALVALKMEIEPPPGNA